ncbi:MAG: hypothetical protein WD990_10380 [Acidimicrobiia bacterium]
MASMIPYSFASGAGIHRTVELSNPPGGFSDGREAELAAAGH